MADLLIPTETAMMDHKNAAAIPLKNRTPNLCSLDFCLGISKSPFNFHLYCQRIAEGRAVFARPSPANCWPMPLVKFQVRKGEPCSKYMIKLNAVS